MELFGTISKIFKLVFVLPLLVVHGETNGDKSIDKYQLVAGRVARFNEFPYVVSIQFKYSSSFGIHFCTGALITRDKVATTSYCIVRQDFAKTMHPFFVNDMVVVTGSRLIYNYSELGHRYTNVINLKLHPRAYINITKSVFKYDAAVLVLENAVKEDGYRAPIGFVSFDENKLNTGWQDLIASKEECTVVGWRISQIQHYKTPRGYEDSRALQVHRVKPVECGDSLCDANPNMCGSGPKSMGILCVNSLEKFPTGKCKWKSGSPLVCNGSLWGVATIYTDDRDCSANHPWVIVRPYALIETLSAPNHESIFRTKLLSGNRSSHINSIPPLFMLAIMSFFNLVIK